MDRCNFALATLQNVGYYFAMIIRAFIKKLGGPKALSQKLSENGHQVSEDNISIWGTRNNIPYKYRLAIARLAKSEAIPLRQIPKELHDFFIEHDAAQNAA